MQARARSPAWVWLYGMRYPARVRGSGRLIAASVFVLACLLGGWLFSLAFELAAPFPTADVSGGSEEAFASGLEPRELPPGQGPHRWISGQARFEFNDVPPGPASVRVRLQGHRGPVTVAADGIVLGVIAAGRGLGVFTLPAGRSVDHVVEVRPPVFVAAGGRRLGALLLEVSLEHPRRRLPSLRILSLVLLPSGVAAILARWAGLSPLLSGVVAAGAMGSLGLMLWPHGLIRSPYAAHLSGGLVMASLVAFGFARLVSRRAPEASAWAHVSILAAFGVQVLAGTSPIMIVSDALFHAHKLEQVFAGDLFPLSVTQHAQPFRFPYGVSFYALLAPFLSLGLTSLDLVRAGAAIAGVLSSAALFWLLLPGGASRAGLSVLVLQLLPGAFNVPYSYGNLSNGFAQAVTLCFFAWWAGGKPGGAALGAALLTTAGLAHLSGLIFLLALVPALLAMDRDRTRFLAVGMGTLFLLLYYAQFTEVVMSQIPRILAGGGQGRGVSSTPWDAARLQVLGMVGQWGLPAIILAALGRPRGPTAIDRGLRAFWLAGALLTLPAVFSPLEARYVYALCAPVAVAAGSALDQLRRGSSRERWLGAALAIALAWVGVQAIHEALFVRYR